MKASDIMTAKVLTCSPDTEVVALAQMMASHGISGVPVLEDGGLVGMVSEGDLMRRGELGGAERTPSWWLRLLGTEESASEYVRSHGRRVRDVMTSDVVSVLDDAPLSEVAHLFERRGIKRAPVIDQSGQLVGIVSRANFVKAIADAMAPGSDGPGDDDAIRDALASELATHNWWRGGVNSVTVIGGVAHFWGYYTTAEELAAARVAAENTAGVTSVEEHRSRYPMSYA